MTGERQRVRAGVLLPLAVVLPPALAVLWLLTHIDARVSAAAAVGALAVAVAYRRR